MEILVIVFVFVVLFIINGQREAAKTLDAKKEPCPPHKWSYVEVKDHEGVVHAHRLVCAKCGPLKSQDSGPRQMDY